MAISARTWEVAGSPHPWRTAGRRGWPQHGAAGRRRVGLATRRARLAVLEPHAVQAVGLLTERTCRRLWHARHGRTRQGHARQPGELVGLDTFSIGQLQGVGQVWQLTACDAVCAPGVDPVSWTAVQVEARLAVFEYIEGWYNPHRRHSALDYESPISYEKKHRLAAPIRKPMTVYGTGRRVAHGGIREPGAEPKRRVRHPKDRSGELRREVEHAFPGSPPSPAART